jgi:hypothetical protein
MEVYRDAQTVIALAVEQGSAEVSLYARGFPVVKYDHAPSCMGGATMSTDSEDEMPARLRTLGHLE